MSLDNKKPLYLVSVDRIDNSKEYCEDNIVLCTYALNSFKFTYEKDDIFEFLKLIKQNYEYKN